MNLIRKQNTWFPSLMDDFLNTNWNIDFPSYSNTLPAVNIKESYKEFSLEIAAPGLNKDDFEVSCEDNILSIEVLQNENSQLKAQVAFLKEQLAYKTFGKPCYNGEVNDK